MPNVDPRYATGAVGPQGLDPDPVRGPGLFCHDPGGGHHAHARAHGLRTNLARQSNTLSRAGRYGENAPFQVATITVTVPELGINPEQPDGLMYPLRMRAE